MLWHHCGTCSSSRMHPCSLWNVWWNSTSDLFSLKGCYKGIQKRWGVWGLSPTICIQILRKKTPVVDIKSFLSWRSWSPRHREWQRSVDELLNQLGAEGKNVWPQRPSSPMKSPPATPQLSPQPSPQASPQVSPQDSPMDMEEGS